MKMTFFSILLFPILVVAETNTGKTISGPETLGQPTYPTSGQTRNRSNDMTGEDMSNATLMGSDQDPRVPTENPTVREDGRSGKKGIKRGPYKDKKFHPREEGPDGQEAQEAAEEGGFDISKEAIERKQHGE
jgi:hypothetical protein